MDLTLGKRRRLQQAASPAGTFTILAIDHRGPLRRELAKGTTDAALAATVVAVKQDIVRELGAAASAVLLDPEAGLAACVQAGALAGSTGLLIALDTGSTGDPAVLETGLVPDWGVEPTLRAGAAGAKLLVYYHPDTPQAAEVERLVQAVAAECAQAALPLFLEPLAYDPAVSGRRLPSPERRRVVLATAQRLVPLGVDVLKVEFPVDPVEEPDEKVWRRACQELTAACPRPWVLLSGGVSYDLFLRQATVACEAGASGIMAGRAIWREAVTADAQARRGFLRGPGRERVRQLRALCDARGRPFAG